MIDRDLGGPFSMGRPPQAIGVGWRLGLCFLLNWEVELGGVPIYTPTVHYGVILLTVYTVYIKSNISILGQTRWPMSHLLFCGVPMGARPARRRRVVP